MKIDPDFGDLPISTPTQDIFGVDPFVQSLARSIRGMRSPQGVVVALNGPWGSGKSSAINLLKHHLSGPAIAEELQTIDFNPWWFRGEEALVLAFFRELHAAVNPTLTGAARKILPKLGARLLKAGGVVAPVADLAGASGTGAVASGIMGWLSGMIEDGESVEKLHCELSAALSAQSKRFVILIDDIDRLAPDEALAMFRLVKSVGRLPNLIYILAFDRLLAERVVADRFPSEGPHYLEKIVQASFELPTPLETDLHRHVVANIHAIVGGIEDKQLVHTMNMFHAIVAPELRTPRDATRYVNALTITWPAVEGDVNLGDFLAVEAYRLFRPSLYRSLRGCQTTLCGKANWDRDRTNGAERLDALLLSDVPEKERYRSGLIRLFPRLDAVWGNTIHGTRGFDRDRRICSNEHFQTYFRLSLDPDVISRKELDAFLDVAGNPKAVRQALIDATGVVQRDGTTRVKALLSALISEAGAIPLATVRPLLRGIFCAVDEINVEADRARGFDVGDNALRVHWLLRALIMDRTSLEERSPIFLEALSDASLGWLGDFAHSAWADFHPREGEPEPENQCLLLEADTEAVAELFRKRITSAAEDGSLIHAPNLLRLLFLWLHFDANGARVRNWIDDRIEDDASLVKLAAACTSHAWTQSSEDLVAKRVDRASINGLSEIMDLDRFRANLLSLQVKLDPTSTEAAIVSRFLAAWKRRDESDGWD